MNTAQAIAPVQTQASVSRVALAQGSGGIVVDISPETFAAARAAGQAAQPNAPGQAVGGAAGGAQNTSLGELNEAGAIRCQTCDNRRYQDGSDDGSVSFQSPAHIDPRASAAVVRAHEQEHVVNEQARAQREGREIVNQSVTLHTSICPECGIAYVSGGVTRTQSRSTEEPGAEVAQLINPNGPGGDEA